MTHLPSDQRTNQVEQYLLGKIALSLLYLLGEFQSLP